MRIAMLTNNHFPPGEGIAHHVKAVAQRLEVRGHKVRILARSASSIRWSEQDCEGLAVREYPYWPLKPFHHWATGRVLRPWLREGADGADLLHVHLPLLPPLATDLPVLATFHSPMLTDNAAILEKGWRPRAMRLNARWFSQAYEQWYLDHASTVIAVSNGVRRELQAHYDLDSQRTTVIGNAVDTAFFRPAPKHARGQHILYVGRLGYRKGLGRLLEAFARLQLGPDCRLEIVGSGPLDAALRQQARQLEIADRVIFRGALDREVVREALGRAALFVNPADYETGPLTVLEALATGTPVVSTPTGLVAEMGENPPLWLAPFETAGLAETIETAWSERHMADKSDRGRTLMCDAYDWDRRVDALLALYERAVACRH